MSNRYPSAFQERRRGKRKAPHRPTSHPRSPASENLWLERLLQSEEVGDRVSEAVCSHDGQATEENESQSRNSQTPASSHPNTLIATHNQLSTDAHEPQSNETKLTFDDSKVEIIHASDSSLEWDQEPFDYVVPMDRPMLHERYSFETKKGLSLAENSQYREETLIGHVGADRRRLERRMSETSDGLSRAFASGSSLAVSTGEQAREYLQWAGDLVGGAVKYGVQVTRDGLELIKEGSRALPALQPRRPKKGDQH